MQKNNATYPQQTATQITLSSLELMVKPALAPQLNT